MSAIIPYFVSHDMSRLAIVEEITRLYGRINDMKRSAQLESCLLFVILLSYALNVVTGQKLSLYGSAGKIIQTFPCFSLIAWPTLLVLP